MNPIYQFFLSSDSGLSDTRVYPIYKDDLAKEYELETNQMFYRAKLSGKLSFLTNEYDLINNAPFDTEFIIKIFISYNGGQLGELYYSGKFTKTDCTFIDYDMRVEVQPEIKDDYTNVLAGLEKEYNLITLTPKIERLFLQKRPLIQVYIPGDNVVTCFLSGMTWEQDATATDNFKDLVDKYKFALSNILLEVNITNSLVWLVNDLYTGSLNIVNNILGYSISGTLRSKIQNDYIITVIYLYQGAIVDRTYVTYRIIRTSDNSIMYEYTRDYSGEPSDDVEFDMQGVNVADTAHAEVATYRIYSRYLLDVDTIQGLPTSNLPSDDIVDYNRGYHKVIGYSIDVGQISMNFSETPQEWGITDDGRYYMPPYLPGVKFYPIARSRWRYASIWFKFSFGDEFLEKEGRKTYTLRDNFSIGACIKALLNQFAPDILHEETPEYSQFLYGESNPITHQKFKLFVSQKTNILNGDYQKPAQKAPATLQQFMSMLRDCFKCYWYIENQRFKIEHVSFFKNGGSYVYDHTISLDLTKGEFIRNSKKWGFNTSEYNFDKVDLAERYQFSWMDDVSVPFKGNPIQVLSKYVTAGKIEDITVSNFTSDIDMLLLNPGDMSDDGFALLAAVNADALTDYYPGLTELTGSNGNTSPNIKVRPECLGRNAILKFIPYSLSGTATGQILFYSNNVIVSTQGNFTADNQTKNINVVIPAICDSLGFVVSGDVTIRITKLEVQDQYELPIIERVIDGVSIFLQNGYLSFLELIPNYWVYDLPAVKVIINNSEYYAQGVERKKKQTLSFPVYEDVNPINLIKTFIGNGQIEKMSINLHSRMSKTTLKYDTE